MKKVLLFSTIALLMVVLVASIFSTNARAETEYTDGYYTYTVSSGNATITKVDKSISGDITIPSTLGGYPVTTIGDKAFMQRLKITSLVIPDSIITIGYSAFNQCNFTNVEIGNNVTTIGRMAFAYCRELNSVVISDSVTSIEVSAFQNCDKLISLHIGKGVTSIGAYAFYECPLTTVYYNGTAEEWNMIDGKYQIESEADEIIFAQSNSIEEAIDGTVLTTGTIGEETVIIVPTSNSVAMTEDELRAIFGDTSVTITSNNGIVGTGCKVTIGEDEVDLVVKGDIDGDGVATVFDALMLKKALVNNGFENEALREFAGDVDGADGTTAADITSLLAQIVGKN